MKIIAADDETIALEVLVDSIKEAEPNAEVISFKTGKEVLEYLSENTCDICFFDIEMRDMNGIELAYEAKKYNSKINIIFVTGYSEYTQDAFEVRASGYVLKPVTAVKIAEELRNLRNPVEEDKNSYDVYVKTFGNFDVYSKGNYTKIIEGIKQLMKANGFMWQPSRTSPDMYETETGYFHKTLCFAIYREEE